MVDVGQKSITRRTATARAEVRFAPGVLARALAADAPKGEVLPVARVAAIQAAKRTAELIPMCHPLRLDKVGVTFEVHEALGMITVDATVTATDRTGVEMEALQAASTAALTIYDMTKSLSKGTRIEALRLLRKTGGKSGDWTEGDA